MTIATYMFNRRMQSIATGDRPAVNHMLAAQIWDANPSEHSAFLLSAYNHGILEWDTEEDVVTEIKLFDMDVLPFCPISIIEAMGVESAYEEQEKLQ